MKLNVIIKFALVAVLSTILVSGCTDECEKTDLGRTIAVVFSIDAQVSSSVNGTEIFAKTVEFRIYKEPCGQAPKGQFGWTALTDGTGYATSGGSAYNMDNTDDLIVATATLLDGNNPSQTKTQTFRASELIPYDGNLKQIHFYFSL